MFPSLIDRSIWNEIGKFWNSNDYYYEPYVDEDGKQVYEIEVPGFNKDNLDVMFENGVVSISGIRETLTGNDVEISKRIVLPDSDVGDVDAEIKDGILRISFKNITPSSKRIELK